MKHMNFVSTTKTDALVVLVIVCISSCSSTILKGYHGPELRKSEIAILKVSEGWTVYSVDGWGNSATPPYSLGLLPGNHTLSVSLDGVFAEVSGQLDAVAGHSYSFVCRTDYIVSLNEHIPKYCGIQDDDASPGMKMIWQRYKGIP